LSADWNWITSNFSDQQSCENKKRVRGVRLDKIPAEIEILKSADVWIVKEVD